MKFRIFVPALIALSLASTAYASEITGTLTAGGSSVTGTVIGIPTASPAPGTYADAQLVALTDPGSSSIRFTTDGSAPSCAGGGSLYTAPIAVPASLTIQAVACYPSGQSSTVGSYAYIISPSGGGLSGTVATSSGGSLSGTVTSSPGGSLSGTVTAPASGSSGGGGGGGGSNGPPVSGGSGGGGGGSIIPTGGSTGTPVGQVLGATTGTTPGVPNTGAGGNAQDNFLLLSLSALIALVGSSYLAMRRSRQH